MELQGDFALHHCIFKDMGIESVSVKLPKDLDGIEGLVIPGGESTTMSLLIDKFDLREPILSFAINYPIMGTCAGLILMAKKVYDSRVVPLGLLNVSVDRNAYGRQIMSSTETGKFYFGEEYSKFPATLIRANSIVEATTHYKDSARVADASTGLKKAMKGLEMSEIPEEERMQERGW